MEKLLVTAAVGGCIFCLARTIFPCAPTTLILCTPGSLNKQIGPGELVALTDHINLQACIKFVSPWCTCAHDFIPRRFTVLASCYSTSYLRRYPIPSTAHENRKSMRTRSCRIDHIFHSCNAGSQPPRGPE